MTTGPELRGEIAQAAHVLARLGLVTSFGHVSARAGTAMLITPAADLATVTEASLVEVPLTATALSPAALPPDAPAEAWAHLALYQARPDAAAIARAQPPSAFAAAAVTSELVPLHGQAAWLGVSVPVHGSATLLRGNGALTLGDTPGLAVTRMWLLAAACEVFLAARAAGPVTPLTADEIAAWRAAGAGLLPRLWQHLRHR